MEKSLVSPEKAKELRDKYLGEDLVNALTAPTPEDFIEERQARGGSMVKYVPGHYFIQRLNECFGFLWTYEVPTVFELNGQIVAKGELSVTLPGRTLTKEFPDGNKEIVRFEPFTIKKTQFGSSEIKRYSSDEAQKDKKGNVVKDPKGNTLWKHRAGDVIDLGDDYKGAATDAMKKCATQFGIFLDVYASRGQEEEGVASRAQFEVLYMRGTEAGMSEEETDKWAEEQLGKPKKEWDPLDVMGLIPKLIDISEGKR
jgi:hypothetical protein